VVDSASIEVSRRGKHAKTDRLDVEKLLTMLLRYHGGETRVWRPLAMPAWKRAPVRPPKSRIRLPRRLPNG
jgi:transposase